MTYVDAVLSSLLHVRRATKHILAEKVFTNINGIHYFIKIQMTESGQVN